MLRVNYFDSTFGDPWLKLRLPISFLFRPFSLTVTLRRHLLRLREDLDELGLVLHVVSRRGDVPQLRLGHGRADLVQPRGRQGDVLRRLLLLRRLDDLGVLPRLPAAAPRPVRVVLRPVAREELLLPPDLDGLLPFDLGLALLELALLVHYGDVPDLAGDGGQEPLGVLL